MIRVCSLCRRDAPRNEVEDMVAFLWEVEGRIGRAKAASACAGDASEQGSVIDKDCRLFANFEYRSVFDWEPLSVCSTYEEEAETDWSPDSLESGRCRIHRTEQRPGWCRPGN
jgi:hypothetical protein